MGSRIDVTASGPSDDLAALGRDIRALRKRNGLTQSELAQAAEISHVTLRRIERGEPSVTSGALAAVLRALGAQLGNVAAGQSSTLPTSITLASYPQLKSLAWQLKPTTKLSLREAWNTYARNWRYLSDAALDPEERQFIDALRREFEGRADVPQITP